MFIVNQLNHPKEIIIPSDLYQLLVKYDSKNNQNIKFSIEEDDSDIRDSVEEDDSDIRYSIDSNARTISIPNEDNSKTKPYEEILNEILNEIKKNENNLTFQEMLLSLIDSKLLTDVQVYKKAEIDRKLFSKIRSDSNYHPTFGTITQLALALELEFPQYIELLNKASYSISDKRKSNIVIKYCFEHKVYNVITVNNLLFTTCNITLRNLR